VAEISEEIERDRPFYEESGGGVTFSGGEPLSQGEFLLACLRECGFRNLHTAVDTCGFADRGLLLEVAKLADLFLFDLKILDSARHLQATSVPVEPILDNLRALDGAGAETLIRFPLIPGVTDERDNVEALGCYVSSLERTRMVQILPFHRTASDKYARLGRSWNHKALEPVSRMEIDKAASILAGFGLEVMTNGRVYE
jgi:pyruvate formate lyase activating enzyme